MAQAALPGLINILKTQGVFEIYLPFLLTFALFYGLLRKIGLFKTVSGKDDSTANKISAVVAFVAAMYITIFSPAAIPISQFFATFFTQSSIAIIVIMVSIMILTMIFSMPFLDQGKKGHIVEEVVHWLVIAALLVAIGMFISSGGVQLFSKMVPPGANINGEDIALIVLIIATVIIISSITKEQPQDQAQQKKFKLIEYE
jgi:hypothetical protein